MNKIYIKILVIVMVVATLILWAVNADIRWTLPEIIMIAGAAIVVGFALFLVIKNMGSVSRKEKVEDELSRRLLTKASSLSYYISLYLWLAIMYFSDKTNLETHTLIGAGILGMALIFFGSWLFVRIKGLKNE